jgi:hypothetical protein
VTALQRLLRLLRLRRSPSRDWYAAGQRLAADMVRGIEQAEARRAALLALGLTPEEAQAVMVQEMFADPGFVVAMAHAEGVVMRSFGTLYEDEGEEFGQHG